MLDPEAITIAAEAFDADPMYRWLLPGERRRRRLLPVFMRRALAGCSLELTRSETGGVEAVVACHDPDREASGGGGAGLSLLTLLATPRRAWRGLSLLRRLKRLRPSEPHVHVEILVVSRAARGRGLAKTLMEDVIERARARGLVTHLETTNPVNIPFYERFGFMVKEEVAGAHPPAWVLQLSA